MVHAVVRGDVTLHSHVRLSTRGAVLALGSRQGEHEASVGFGLRGDHEAIIDNRRPTWG